MEGRLGGLQHRQEIGEPPLVGPQALLTQGPRPPPAQPEPMLKLPDSPRSEVRARAGRMIAFLLELLRDRLGRKAGRSQVLEALAQLRIVA